MDPKGDKPLDYGDRSFAGNPGAAAIPALADDEMIDDDDYDDLYNDVNVGDHFTQQRSSHHQNLNPPNPNPRPSTIPYGSNGSLPSPVQPASMMIGTPVKAGVPDSIAPQQNPIVVNNNNFNNSRAADYAQVNSDISELGLQRGPVAPIPAKAPSAPVPRAVDVNGPTMLFVGELHWWTTDADLEGVLTRFGRVKEIKFFDERASGKSKGYCQVEFYDAASAAACKVGMDGHDFNGRPCVVAFASPQTLKQISASYVSRNQGQGQMQQQDRRHMNEGMGRGGGGGGGGGDGGGRNFGRGGWGGGGRGGQGMMNRGQGGGMRGRGFSGGRGVMGPGGGGVGSNGPFGQGLGGPTGFGGPAGMMNPQNMMVAGFDPTYMGRGGPYGGFSGPAFMGMMPPFQAVNAYGLPGVAPHVNPAFFGRGMAANGMGVTGSNGMEGQMWGDAGIGGGWSGEEQGRAGESSYGGDDGASEYGHGEVNHERGGRSNVSREKDKGSEHDWSGNLDKRHRDDKVEDRDRSDREQHREEKDSRRDYRSRDRDYDNESERDRGQLSSRSRRQEDDHKSRSRDADYGKRRRE